MYELIFAVLLSLCFNNYGMDQNLITLKDSQQAPSLVMLSIMQLMEELRLNQREHFVELVAQTWDNNHIFSNDAIKKELIEKNLLLPQGTVPPVLAAIITNMVDPQTMELSDPSHGATLKLNQLHLVLSQD